eukprot:c10112_g1_i2 orf=389-1891(+)
MGPSPSLKMRILLMKRGSCWTKIVIVSIAIVAVTLLRQYTFLHNKLVQAGIADLVTGGGSFLTRKGLKQMGQDIDRASSDLQPDQSNKDFGGQEAGHLEMRKDENFRCDRSAFHTDVCNMRGDVRMDANKSSFVLFAAMNGTLQGEEKIRPYSRKWEKHIMDSTVHELLLISTDAAAEDHARLECQVHHNVPGIVFSTGGYTGNMCHEFNDGIIPLFITSQHLRGEVVFIIVDFHNWWMSKYSEIIRQLSNYPIINFENETRIHCFPEVSIGLYFHAELSIDPTLMPHHESIHNFRSMLGRAYFTSPTQEWSYFNNSNRPRLVLIVRDGTRVILNQDEVVQLAEEVGFQVLVWKPERTTMLKTAFGILNESHVLMGVHGAALTHFLFMRSGTVFIQILPFGTEWAGNTYYAEPASRFGLYYTDYKIDPEESTLSSKYDKSDIIFTDPKTIFLRHGWGTLKEIYLEGQNVNLSLSRFRNVLLDAKQKALHFMMTEDSITIR